MSAITITFGDCAENHVGMQKIGTSLNSGFTFDELVNAYYKFTDKGCKCELYDLAENSDYQLEEKAYFLVVKQGVKMLLEEHKRELDEMYEEHSKLDVDKKAFMRGRVVNKHARHNLCFDDVSQEPDYCNGKGRIVSYSDVPLTNLIRNELPAYFGEKANDLKAEGNYYYDISKCGIGFHGDSERKIVVGCRLGVSFPMHFQWYHQNSRIGSRIIIPLDGGDIYAMSEKAVGTDWKRKIVPTLRHAAGCDKYTK